MINIIEEMLYPVYNVYGIIYMCIMYMVYGVCIIVDTVIIITIEKQPN